jgi:hypothetical protein
LVCNSALQAAEGGAPGVTHGKGGGASQERMAQMMEYLGLSAEQKAGFLALQREHYQKWNNSGRQGGMTPEHRVTMWPQFPTPAEAAIAYEAYLRAAFAKPYILGYFKCQYVDQVLPTGMLKQGLHKRDGTIYEEFAGLLKALHQRLIEQLEKEGRLARQATPQ